MTTPDAKPHDPYAAIRIPNFRWFVGGFLPFHLGHQMLAAGIAWELYDRTGDVIHLGYVGLARAAPAVALSLIGGHFADIHNRRTILIYTLLIFAVNLAALALWSQQQGPLWVGYLLLVLLGVTRAFNGPARGSMLPLIVEPAAFHNAVTWNTGAFYLSGILGPIIAGWLYAWRHTAWEIYTIGALFNLLFCLAATRLKLIKEQTSAGKITLNSLLGGMSFVYQDKPVFGALIIDCLGVLIGGAVALMPAFAKDILHEGPETFGLLKSMVFIGSLVSALILAYRPPFKNAGRAFLIAVTIWAIATIGFGLSKTLWLALFFLFVQGFVDNISVVIRHVLIQTRTPDHLRGRVSAVNGLFIDMSNELGGYESSLVAKWFTVVASIVSGGIGTLFVVAIVAATNKPLRTLKRIDPGADEQSPGSV